MSKRDSRRAGGRRASPEIMQNGLRCSFPRLHRVLSIPWQSPSPWLCNGNVGRGCAEYCTQRQTTHVHCSTRLSSLAGLGRLGQPICCIRPVSRLIRHSPVTSHYPALSKLETELQSSNPIIIYPPLNSSLMQAIKDSNMGKHILSTKHVVVEDGRGE